MKKALLLLAASRGISTYPAVYQCAEELKKRGFHVAILTGSKCDDPKLEKNFDSYYEMKTLKYIGFFSEILLATFYLITKSYDYVFAFEPRDAKNASFYSFLRYRKINFIYYNLEIFMPIYNRKSMKNLSHIRRLRRLVYSYYLSDIFLPLFKKLEVTYSKKCKYLVIQDKVRDTISKKYGVYNKNTIYIPNSYYKRYKEKSDLRMNEKPSVIYSGALSAWSVKSLFEQLNKLFNVNITFSGWFSSDVEDYIHEIKKNDNIVLLDNKLTIEEYASLIGRHHIGLVWYSSDLDNVKYIGRSSGKYFMYLSCGKPVIVQNLPGIAEDVCNFKIGVVIESVEEIAEAVKTIMSDYKQYVQNVSKTYDEVYEYSIASKEFFNCL